MYDLSETQVPSATIDRRNPLLVSVGINLNDDVFKGFKSYRENGLKHFSAQKIPLELFDSIVRFLGERRLSKILRGVVKPSLNFVDISQADEMRLDEEGFAAYLDANKHKIRNAMLICIEEHGESVSYELMGAALEDYTDGAADATALIKVVLNSNLSTLNPKAVEALCRLNFLIDKQGEYEFWFNGHNEEIYSGLHTIKFYEKNRQLIVDWLESCLPYSGKDSVELYALTYLKSTFSCSPYMECSARDIADALKEKTGEEDLNDLECRRLCACGLMEGIGAILNDSCSKYLDDGLPF